jgi:hypothetical protein
MELKEGDQTDRGVQVKGWNEAMKTENAKYTDLNKICRTWDG